MSMQDKDITLTPRNRADLLDDEVKLGTIKLTKEEKLVLAKGLDTPLWDVMMKIWLKQRMMQLAATCINVSHSHEDLIAYQGQLKELRHMEGDLRKIAEDFKRSEEKKQPDEGGQPSPTGAREKISQVR